MRLAVALALMTIGSSAMYVIAVVLPAVQKEFGVYGSDASAASSWGAWPTGAASCWRA